MIVTITSYAPVRALSTPTIQPITAPPTNAPSTQTMTWITGGRLTPKPSQVATIARPTHWPAAQMLNSPVRNAIATDRPVRISGVALAAVSDSGNKIAAIDPPWNAALTVDGLRIAPSNIWE